MGIFLIMICIMMITVSLMIYLFKKGAFRSKVLVIIAVSYTHLTLPTIYSV